AGVKLKLVPHPEFPCAALGLIEVEVTRASPTSCALAYRATGRIADLVLAPSSEWAAYGFSGYREGMATLELPTPRIQVRRGDEAFELDVVVDLAGFLAPDVWRLAISAVIEERSGAKSYWALAHPDGRPDFHAEAGFVARLP